MAALDNARIRVMLVDDSAVIRRLVADVLRSEPGIEVVGTAVNGQDALDHVDTYQPHVVILDVEMPVLDGVATVRQLRARWPVLPVIMFSSLTERGASATLDALSNGASDYATKPSTAGTLSGSLGAVRNDLVPLVRSWGAIGRRRLTKAVSPAPVVQPPNGLRASTPRPVPVAPERIAPPAAPVALRSRAPKAQISAVVIGTSTGGPNALGELIPQLPGNLPVPVLLVQHMPETFTSLLAQRLDRTSALRVTEAVAGQVVTAGNLYVARGGHHLVVRRSGPQVVLALDDGPPENSCRPAVDVLFRSAVGVWGGGLLGVVMTGMGQDGLVGSRLIDQAGGAVITQDEPTSVIWGMPGAVATAGLSSENLPLERMAAAIVRRVGSTAKVGNP